MNCARCNKRLSRKTARMIDGEVVCGACMFGGRLAHVKGCSLHGIPYRLASCGCRDSDASLAEDAKRLSPEAATAGAEGIAQTPSPRKSA